MNISFENFDWVEFNQERITIDLKQRIDLFEFSSLYPKEEPQFYAQVLMKKLLSINQVLLSKFLQYHCKMSKDPIQWLTSLDSLLEKNIDELLRLGFSVRLNEMFITIDKFKAMYLSASGKGFENNLEIDRIKEYCKNLSSFNEKKTYLLRKKTDYLQHNVAGEIEPSLDKQIDLELSFLKIEMKLLRDSNKDLEEENFIMVWNGQVQQLVEIFYSGLHETNEAGQPLIKASNEEVVQFIIRYFKRQDASSFSAASIRSLLRPSRQRARSKPKKKNDDK